MAGNFRGRKLSQISQFAWKLNFGRAALIYTIGFNNARKSSP